MPDEKLPVSPQPNPEINQDTLIYPPTSNQALDDLITDNLMQGPVDFSAIEADLLARIADIPANYLTSNSIFGLVFETHLRRVLESVRHAGRYKGEGLVGTEIEGYEAQRFAESNLVIESNADLITSGENLQVDGDIILRNTTPEGGRSTYRMGIFEAKVFSPSNAESRQRMTDAMSIDRVNDFGRLMQAFQKKDTRCTGWAYAIAVPMDLDNSDDEGSYQHWFVHVAGGRIVRIPITRRDLIRTCKTNGMLERLLAAKGLPQERAGVPENDDDVYPERAAWREEYESPSEDS